MIRLHMLVEGQTEQRFTHNMLVPHLASCNVFLDVRCVRTSRSGRGGMTNYEKAQKDIQGWMKEIDQRWK